jgi:voltage-gated sodium channel
MIKRLFLNDGFILTLIIINALTIMLGAFDSLTHIQSQAVFLADNITTSLFLVELTVKFIHYRPMTYFSSSWNRFDFTLIILSVPALISWIFGLDLANLSILLVFRILRVFKSFRFLKFVPGIDSLLQGVLRALKTSVIIILGFIIYVFIIGVLSCYLFRHISPEYFSNPLISFYSTFKVFTMEGWYEIPDSIALNSPVFTALLTRVYFIFILITGGIFGLSLVNSIFVEAMLSDNTDDIEKKVDILDKKVSEILKKLSSE